MMYDYDYLDEKAKPYGGIRRYLMNFLIMPMNLSLDI